VDDCEPEPGQFIIQIDLEHDDLFIIPSEMQCEMLIRIPQSHG